MLSRIRIFVVSWSVGSTILQRRDVRSQGHWYGSIWMAGRERCDIVKNQFERRSIDGTCYVKMKLFKAPKNVSFDAWAAASRKQLLSVNTPVVRDI
ncbi:hypothetical protein BDY19DRAFT_976514 [Irpex rosettiformis]|uniref:Uncharacterized protein n=1 Tax=Irpex rosettiformis TaxID=378272 RepID=A0ACB8TNL8_9APHY|nr:hypothetical protein BDY19DRAFT_976514 [Irpex rosettiformis]